MPGRRLPSPKAVPWALLLEVAAVARDHWQGLPERDRARLSELIRKSRGRRGNLSKRERDDVRRILGKLDYKAMGKDLVPFVGRARGSRRGPGAPRRR
jgi:hypothetical protein